ncbi:hypothetical protein [Pseudorhodoferax sp. Leaf265]|uniref:hypothetical protein n=1 Tax=Pseudorhodoferax sp. Leaf265 TaxID=1736315 RepID=UPI0012E7D771|nr:hypothetical protein [Pseudorhodoferax sp. Leaf265]
MTVSAKPPEGAGGWRRLAAAVLSARRCTGLARPALPPADLVSLAVADSLTGLADRRRFDENLATQWRGCRSP